VWNTLQLIAPVFGLALIGYLSSWIGLIGKDGVRGLSRFAFRIAIPAMLIRAMADLALRFEWELLASYFGGTFATYALAMLVGTYLFQLRRDEVPVFGFGPGFSNLVMVGIPFVQVAYGDAGLLPLYIILSLHAPLLYLVGTSLLNVARGADAETTNVGVAVLKAQAANPIVIALAIGLTLNVTDLDLGGPIDAIIGMLSDAALPCTLFTLGASLSSYRLTGQIRRSAALIGLKNGVHPAIVYLLVFHVFDLNPEWASVTVVIAALPMGMNAYLFAEDSDVLAPTMAATVVLSTAVSILSLSFVHYLVS
jgi:malonate transporter